MTRSDLERELEGMHASSFGWALACCGWDRHEAEEVLQTAYLKVLGGRAAFDGRSRFRTWWFGVIRLTAWERRRRAARRLRLLAAWISGRATRSAPARDPAAAHEAVRCHARLRGELTRLPRRQREVLHLVYYQEMTIEEAARVMGIALGTARTHYERGKQQLRRRLGSDGP